MSPDGEAATPCTGLEPDGDPRRHGVGQPGRAALAFGASAFMLLAAWSIATPLFASPDENAHFVKAAAVVRGVLVGDGIAPTVPDSYWSTEVAIDPQFNAANWVPWCFAPDPTRPACNRPVESTDPRQDTPFTTMGRYPPVAYVAPGLATLAGPNDFAARLGRLFNAAVCAALLSAAWYTMARRGVSRTALLVAATPGTIFLAASINPSGTEICGAIASWTLLRALLGRERGLDRIEYIALAVSLVVVTTARPIGPVMTLLIAGLATLASGVRLADVARQLRRSWHVASIVSVAAVAMAGWYLGVFSANTSSSVVSGEPSISLMSQLAISIGHLPGLVAEAVGNFGWLDTPTPTVALWLVLGATTIMVASAWSSLDAASRLAIAAIIGVTVALSVTLDLNYYRLLRNFGGQGRHLMPILVGIPIVAAWRWRPGRPAEIALAATWTIAVTACAVYAVRRYAVGVVEGNFLEMFTSPVWTPPLGVVGSMLAVALTATAVAWTALRNP